MEPMQIPEGTPSLLYTLLEEFVRNPDLYTQYTNDPTVQAHIEAVVEAVRPPRPFRRNLVKDAAQRKLYYVLYEIIEKEYAEPHEEPSSDPKTIAARNEDRAQNRILNSAIGRALENAIRGELKEEFPQIQILRDELRKGIIEALTPKQP
jgi:hypothetical protein